MVIYTLICSLSPLDKENFKQYKKNVCQRKKRVVFFTAQTLHLSFKPPSPTKKHNNYHPSPAFILKQCKPTKVWGYCVETNLTFLPIILVLWDIPLFLSFYYKHCIICTSVCTVFITWTIWSYLPLKAISCNAFICYFYHTVTFNVFRAGTWNGEWNGPISVQGIE